MTMSGDGEGGEDAASHCGKKVLRGDGPVVRNMVLGSVSQAQLLLLSLIAVAAAERGSGAVSAMPTHLLSLRQRHQSIQFQSHHSPGTCWCCVCTSLLSALLAVHLPYLCRQNKPESPLLPIGERAALLSPI